MNQLYCLPLGSSLRDEFLAKIEAEYKSGRETADVLLLPSSFLLQCTRAKIRQEGRISLCKTRLLSFDDMAEEIVHLAGLNRGRIDRLTQELLISQILTEFADSGMLPYFSQIANFPGYVSDVTTLIGEWKRSACSVEQMEAVLDTDELPEKYREIFLIYRRYQERLTELELTDLEEGYILANQILEQGDVGLPYRKIFISEFYDFTELQMEFIRRIKRLLPVEIAIYYEKQDQLGDVPPPGPQTLCERTYSSLVGAGFHPVFMKSASSVSSVLQHVRTNLFQLTPAIQNYADGIRIAVASNRLQSARLVLRRCKELIVREGLSPDDIVIIARDPENYPEMGSLAEEYGVPVSMSRQEALGDQAVACTMRAAIRAQIENGSRISVKEFAKSPLVEACCGVDGDQIEREAAESYIENWQDWLAWCSSSSESTCANGIRALRDLVRSLPLRGTCDQFVVALISLMDRLRIEETYQNSWRDKTLPSDAVKAGLLATEKVRTRLEALPRGFAQLGIHERILTLEEFLDLFERAIASERVALQRRSIHGVQFVSPEAARGITFQASMVLGLTEGEFPLPERENWLMTELERRLLEELGVSVGKKVDQVRQEEMYFAIAVSSADKYLELFATVNDAVLESSFINEIRRLFVSIDKTSIITTEKTTSSDIFPVGIERVFGRADLNGSMLQAGFSLDEPKSEELATIIRTVVEQLGEDFRRRTAVEFSRSAGEETAYGGLVLTDAARDYVLQQFAPRGVYNVSKLEAYAQCPFAFLLSNGMKLDELSESEEDTEASDIGTIYHQVLADFLRRHAGTKLDPDCREAYRPEIALLFEDACEKIRAKGTRLSGSLWRHERARMLISLERWLDFEIKEQNALKIDLTPCRFEWAFGMRTKDDVDRQSTPQPFELTVDGQVLPFDGKVDRIDCGPEGWAVYDYKLSKLADGKDILVGIDLQLMLYLMAVQQLLAKDTKLLGAKYYSVEKQKKTGGIVRKEGATIPKGNSALECTDAEWDAAMEQVKTVIKTYVDAIKDGRFPLRPAGKCAGYCIGSGICRFTQTSVSGEGDNA